MKESTKIISSTIIGSSLLTFALAVGTTTAFRKQIKDKFDKQIKRLVAEILTEQHTFTASGRDTPVGVRGGSIIGRTWRNQEMPVFWTGNGPNAFIAKVPPGSKGTISIYGPELADTSSTTTNSWKISITGRLTGGKRDPTGSDGNFKGAHGVNLCSNPDCSVGKPLDPNDLYVYLTLINPVDNPKDVIDAPDVDDDPLPAGQYHRRSFHNGTSKCQGCDYVSYIFVDTGGGTPIPYPCHNGSCEVGIGVGN